MATIKFHNVGIKAMSACVPQEVFCNRDLGYLIPEEEIEKTINTIGIKERRLAGEGVCASDLCYKAALQLMADNGINPESIDVLLFMSQSHDYKMPATAPILQHRLGLSKKTACLDLTLACSGYIYALSTAYAYASMEGINRVLLLDGETLTKIVNRRDKVNWPLYGDAAAATLIEKGDFGDSVFILCTDGSGEDAVKVYDGGMRNGTTQESLMEREREDGNIRNNLQIYMDGMDVFNFTMRVVPKSIKEICSECNVALEDVDWLVFHQANRFMTDFFVKKLKFNPGKVPYCLDKYGNTSSVSVPLTIVSELKDRLKNGDRLVLSGFGAGLSWGTAMIEVNGCRISNVIEY